MTWVAVAIGGSAVLGAGASYLGSKKQSDAASKAAGLNMDQFKLLNQQQQPFIQSGYGALGKLNTLLGLSPNPNMQGGGGMPQGPQNMPPNGLTVNNGPNGAPTTFHPGITPMPGGGQGQSQIPNQNINLRHILSLRAANGDKQAAQMLGMI